MRGPMSSLSVSPGFWRIWALGSQITSIPHPIALRLWIIDARSYTSVFPMGRGYISVHISLRWGSGVSQRDIVCWKGMKWSWSSWRQLLARIPSIILNGPVRAAGGPLSFPYPRMGLAFPDRSTRTPWSFTLISSYSIPTLHAMDVVTYSQWIMYDILRRGYQVVGGYIPGDVYPRCSFS